MKVKVYILGIKRQFRGEQLLRVIAENGYDVEVVWGIDAQAPGFPIFRDDSKSTFFYRRRLTDGEIACTLGHMLILNQAKKDDVDFALVLEDDVEIVNLEEVFSSVSDFSSLSPSIILLIVDRRLTISSRLNGHANNGRLYKRILSNPSPTSAYVVNRLAIETLTKVDKNQLRGFQADFPPNWYQMVHFYELQSSHESIRLSSNVTLIPNRNRSFEDSDSVVVRFFKLLSANSISNSKFFGVSFLAYCAHFLGRSLAWRIAKRQRNT